MKTKNSALAFFLSFIPGVGFLYMSRIVRGIFYSFAFFGTLFAGVSFTVLFGFDTLLLALMVAGVIFFIQMIDMIIFLLNEQKVEETEGKNGQGERFLTLLLSLIPGLGHFHLGLMYRGLTFLIASFGTLMMVIFIVILTRETSFIIFLGLLMIIWILNIFDTVHLLDRIDRGEPVWDRTILEDLEAHREAGKKSRFITLLLSVIPGAGHMYIGLQQRGLQLMIAFFLAIFLIDFMRMPLFMFLIPIIWFFSFFDALQKMSDMEVELVQDVPIVTYFIHKQRWLGGGLIFLGAYYLFDHIIRPELLPYLSQIIEIDLVYLYNRYAQVTIVSLILIGGGMWLMTGRKEEGKSQ